MSGAFGILSSLTLIIAIASGGATVAPQAHDPVQARRRHGRSIVAKGEGCDGVGGILRDQAGGAQIVGSHGKNKMSQSEYEQGTRNREKNREGRGASKWVCRE
jgi:hypothetical protein